MLEMIHREYWLQIYRELKTQMAELEKMAMVEAKAKEVEATERRARLCRQYDAAIAKADKGRYQKYNKHQHQRRKALKQLK